MFVSGNFTCSWSGKYVACGMLSGEVEIYSGMHLLANTINSTNDSRSGEKSLVESTPVESAPPTVHSPKICVNKRRHTAKKHSSNVSRKVTIK